MSITITHDDRTSGLSLTAKVLSGATVAASGAMTEPAISGVVGRYSATISSLADGDYSVVVVDASGKVYGGGPLRVAGNAEISTALSAAEIAAAVWSATTRTLTGFGTLIADLWVHATRTLTADPGAAGHATTQAAVAAVQTKTDRLPVAPAATSDIPSADAIAAAMWAEHVEPDFTARRMLRIVAASVAGKTSGGPGGFVARDLSDTQDMIVGAADMASGDRVPTAYGGV